MVAEEKLVKIVGAGNVSREQATLNEYSRDINFVNTVKPEYLERVTEYAWCYGAGGGVKETNPEFAKWTAKERIAEAESTGAEAIVTACPGCEQNLGDTIKENGSSLKVYDVVELLAKAI